MKARRRSISPQSSRLISASRNPANAPIASIGTTPGALDSAASSKAATSLTEKISGALSMSFGRLVRATGLVSIIRRLSAYPKRTLIFARKFARVFGAPSSFRSQSSNSSTLTPAIGFVPKSRQNAANRLRKSLRYTVERPSFRFASTTSAASCETVMLQRRMRSK